ncbi:MAG TPA: hypothetical protein VFE05_19625 [Longimicrobiaceae bacterium]|jgi:hypothetical protein|nr:hypothetical protein [Longimicrobiaceae bacterium]
MRRLGPFVLASLMTAFPVPAWPQTLSDQVREMFTFGNCGEPLCLNVVGHGDHFIPDVVQGQDNMIGFLGSSIGISVANVPVSAGSGGATFTFRNGVPVRTSVSSGPILGERAQTIGRGRFLVGGTLSSFHFTTLRGMPLRDLEFNFKHSNVGDPAFGTPAIENDVIQVHADMAVDLWAASVFVTAGVGDRVDVGAVLPLLRLSLRGRSRAEILPFGSDTHHFDGGLDEAQAFAEGSARGVGDLALRAKATVRRTARSGVAVLADVRLPTGDEKNFLGAGAASVRGLAIVSGRLGAFSPHFNGGFLYRGGHAQNSAVLATVGFDHLVSPAVTLAGDVVTEWQVGASRLKMPGPLRFTIPTSRTLEATNIPDSRDDVVSAALGVKVVLRPGMAAVANTVMPVMEGGLQPRVAVSFGLEASM